MKKSRFTETQITRALKAYEAGKDIQQICWEMNINRATFYNCPKGAPLEEEEVFRHGCGSAASI